VTSHPLSWKYSSWILTIIIILLELLLWQNKKSRILRGEIEKIERYDTITKQGANWKSCKNKGGEGIQYSALSQIKNGDFFLLSYN